MTLKDGLSVTSNVVFIVIALALAAGISRNFSRHTDPSELTLGSKAEMPLQYSASQHPHTLIIAVRNGCHFCKDSAPFYGRLADAWHSDHLNAQPLFLDPDSTADQDKEWNKTSLGFPVYGDSTLSTFHIEATPTLILTDAHSKVERVWVGRLSKQGEAEVLSALAN